MSFSNAAAFNRIDTLPLTPWVKALLVLQACISLRPSARVAARSLSWAGKTVGPASGPRAGQTSYEAGDEVTVVVRGYRRQPGPTTDGARG